VPYFAMLKKCFKKSLDLDADADDLQIQPVLACAKIHLVKFSWRSNQ